MASVLPPLDPEARRTLAFQLMLCPSIRSKEPGISFCLQLAERTIRQEGSAGRLVRLNASYPVQPPAPRARPLIRRILSRHPANPLPLSEAIHDLVAAWPVDLSLDQGPWNQGPRLRLARIERLELQTGPVAWQAPDLIRYGPQLAVRGHCDEASTPLVAVCADKPELANGKTLLLSRKTDTLFWSDEMSILPVAVLRLWQNPGGLAHEELAALIQDIPTSQRFAIQVPAIPLIRRDPPRLVLRLSAVNSFGSSTTARVSFAYGATVHLSDAGPLGTIKSDAGRAELWLRDFAFEAQAIQRLKQLGFVNADPGTLGLPQPLADVVAIHLEGLLDQGFEVWLDNRRIRKAATRISPRISSGVDWLEFTLETQGDEASVPFDPETIDTFGLVRAGDAWWLVKPDDAGLIEAYVRSRHHTGTAASARVYLYDFTSIESLTQLDAFSGISSLALRRDIGRKLLGHAELPHCEIPADFRASLRPYQWRGYEWLCYLAQSRLGGVLADDMGLGKTVQALALLSRLADTPEPGQSLVVAPLSVLSVWEQEAHRFAPSLKVLCFHGPHRSALELDRADLILTSYQTLIRESQGLGTRTFRCLILDEAQHIKNPDSKAARSVRGLRADCRFALSGTPFENRCMDIWSIFSAVLPGLLGTQRDFREAFEKPIEALGDKAAATKLQSLCAPFLLRRLKEAVLTELPARQITDQQVRLGNVQSAFYERLKQDIAKRVQAALDSPDEGRFSAIFPLALLRLRQAAIHPRLIAPDYPQGASAKFVALDELVTHAVMEGHRVLVFSQFTAALDLVEQDFKHLRIAWARLDGSTVDRDKQIAAFSKPAGPPVFLISLKAGGVGLNLCAADYVVLLDPWWNPAAEAQAIDRAHRMGQTRPVFVYRLIAKDTIEARVLALQERKRQLAGQLIGNKGLDPRTLRREEVLELFS